MNILVLNLLMSNWKFYIMLLAFNCRIVLLLFYFFIYVCMLLYSSVSFYKESFRSSFSFLPFSYVKFIPLVLLNTSFGSDFNYFTCPFPYFCSSFVCFYLFLKCCEPSFKYWEYSFISICLDTFLISWVWLKSPY